MKLKQKTYWYSWYLWITSIASIEVDHAVIIAKALAELVGDPSRFGIEAK